MRLISTGLVLLISLLSGVASAAPGLGLDQLFESRGLADGCLYRLVTQPVYAVPLTADDVQVLLPERISGRKVVASVISRSQGRVVGNQSVALDIEIHSPVPVSTRAISRGEVLSADDYSAEMRVSPSCQLQTSFNPAGMRAKTQIAKGVALTPHALERVLVVHKGQEVRIRLLSGAVELDSLARAKGDAAVGDSVVVQFLNSSRELSGVLDGSGVILIAMGQ